MTAGVKTDCMMEQLHCTRHTVMYYIIHVSRGRENFLQLLLPCLGHWAIHSLSVSTFTLSSPAASQWQWQAAA